MTLARHSKPRSIAAIGSLLLLGAALALGVRPARADDAPADEPVVATPAGKQAFEDVRAAYASEASSVPRTAEAAATLGSPDAEKRAWAAAYLVAVFRQTRSDEEHARTPLGRGMKLGPGPQDDGAAIRWAAMRQLWGAAVAPGTTDALEPAQWLWREGGSRESRSAAMWLFSQMRHADADAAILEAVRDDDATTDVLHRALYEVWLRRLPGVEERLRLLCLHHEEPVRSTAASAAAALGLADLPTYSDASPLVPSLDRRLRDMAARVRPTVPADATWVRIRAGADPENRTSEEERCGWRLPDQDGTPVVLDALGEVIQAEGGRWEILEDTIADAARRWLEVRAEFDTLERNDFDGRRRLEGRMGIPRWSDHSDRKWAGTLPEVLIAAWAHVRGDEATAKALVLPILPAAGGEAALFQRARDEVAVRLDQRMLTAFFRAEYGTALDLARHLASPLFDGWYAQDRAKELADEIPRRGDDFAALSLPSAAAWEAMRASMPRMEWVGFLADRLRLIRSQQGSIPGGISYGDDQHAPAAESLAWHDPKREAYATINPFVELLNMDLRASEVGPLLPLLASRDHVLAFDLERFGNHYPQTFHRVAWVAGTLLDAVAAERVVDRGALAGGEADRVAAEIERLRAWFEARGEESRSDRLVVVAAEREWEEANGALRSLAGLAPDRGAAAAARRAATDAEHREALARYVANVGGKGETAAARGWIEDGDARVRFFGAWILVRHGDRAAREGLDVLLAALRAGEGWKLRDAVLDDLVATGDAAATAFVEACADPTKPEGAHPSLFLLQRRALAGDATALDRVLDAMGGKGLPILGATPGDDRNRYGSDEITTAVGVALGVARWRSDHVEWPYGDDDAAKAKREAVRTEIATWLREQAALVRAGKPTAFRPARAPMLWGDWGWISSGWVRRM